MLIINILIETNFPTIYCDHNLPSPNSLQILPTSPPAQIYGLSLSFSLSKTNKLKKNVATHTKSLQKENPKYLSKEQKDKKVPKQRKVYKNKRVHLVSVDYLLLCIRSTWSVVNIPSETTPEKLNFALPVDINCFLVRDRSPCTLSHFSSGTPSVLNLCSPCVPARISMRSYVHFSSYVCF